ncbi:HAD family phosphatase [Candidatus Dojkabacteria bacterium]|uniref:HAD family phosphatase n=1 Tax=Candidatus Dojkabacteria bacterium TaxID=2099670 RepID=A0A955L884_9BACT|nr:HAD family phosphatase [Candidatus Dojkabacteria bacterium]
MIKAIIFDFGNVISTFDNDLFIARIDAYSNFNTEELHNLIYEESGLTDLYERGEISSNELFEEISKLCNLSMPIDKFRIAYGDIFTPIPTTIDLVKKLKQKYKIALLSNTSEWDFEIGIEACEVFDLFDAVTLSHVVGVKKPGQEIYNDSLGKLGLKPEECVYIDDIKEYADKAKELGIHGIHYKSQDGLMGSLKALGIIV